MTEMIVTTRDGHMRTIDGVRVLVSSKRSGMRALTSCSPFAAAACRAPPGVRRGFAAGQ